MLENKEWLLSGVGAALLAGIIILLFSHSKRQPNQRQRIDSGSTNIQAGGNVTVQTGITLTDAKQLFLDLFQENFIKLGHQAEEIARNRVEDITEDFLAKLQKSHPEGLHSAQDPDFQYSLLTVQRAYARSGNRDLGDLLVDVLVERTKFEQDSLIQIVLNESLTTIPKLTLPQIRALAIMFLVKHVFRKKAKAGEADFFDFVKNVLVPISHDLPNRNSDYRHLEYTGCAIRTGHFIEFNTYVVQEFSPESGIRRTISQRFSEEIATIPNIRSLIGKWNSSDLGQMNITTVGIAIANAYMHSKTGLFGDPLIWLD